MLRYSLMLMLAGLLAMPTEGINNYMPGKVLRQHLNKVKGSESVKHKLLKEGKLGDAQEKTIEVPIDHFVTNGTQPTYKMRYLIDESQAQGQTNPPILFYTGNEGDINAFYDNSGFITKNLSIEFKGVVVFGEHRYYGTSMPFGDQSFTKENVKFLTVDQTLMDFVKLIKYIKSSNTNYAKSPVFAFGGSYGGMLSAWMRMKYPHIIQGAHAASAPILFFPGTVSPYAWNELATRTYKDTNKKTTINIEKYIKSGFDILAAKGNDTAFQKQLSDLFKTCKPISSQSEIDYLTELIADCIGSLAQYDYPYDTNMSVPLPGYPVDYAANLVAK
jgi:lysosomal Pro-X carboxypeptidase